MSPKQDPIRSKQHRLVDLQYKKAYIFNNLIKCNFCNFLLMPPILDARGRRPVLSPSARHWLKMKIFPGFILFPFDAKLLCFGFVLFQINSFNEKFCFVLKSKQFRFVVGSKPNCERLHSSRVTNMLYTRSVHRICSRILKLELYVFSEFGL